MNKGFDNINLVDLFFVLNKSAVRVLDQLGVDICSVNERVGNNKYLDDLTSEYLKAIVNNADLIAFDPNFRVWQILTLGNFQSTDQLISELERKDIEVINWVKKKIEGINFSFALPNRYHLALSSLDELGSKSLLYADILETVKNSNGKLCPHETVMQLLLQVENFNKSCMILPVTEVLEGNQLLYIHEGDLRICSLDGGKLPQAIANKLMLVYIK